jgi:hypothetical protein
MRADTNNKIHLTCAVNEHSCEPRGAQFHKRETSFLLAVGFGGAAVCGFRWRFICARQIRRCRWCCVCVRWNCSCGFLLIGFVGAAFVFVGGAGFGGSTLVLEGVGFGGGTFVLRGAGFRVDAAALVL